MPLVLVGALLLLMVFGFSTLSAGDVEEGSLEWWQTVLETMFDRPQIYVILAGVMGGVGLCLYRPGRKITVGGAMAMTGVVAVLLGLFLRTASREREQWESSSPNPDGTKHVVKFYRNWFGQERTAESDEP
ncbi:MAG: hypothetical protein U0835_16395 [Isosphaeraceae bacterium]